MSWHPGHEKHLRTIEVDSNDVMCEVAWSVPFETICGDVRIIGRVSVARANAVRRATAAKYRAMGRTRDAEATEREAAERERWALEEVHEE